MHLWAIGTITVGVVGVDQLSKAWVVTRLPNGAEVSLPGPASIRRVSNERGGWLKVTPFGAVVAWFVVALAVTVAAIAGPSLLPAQIAGAGAIIGGATGNLIDRITRGGIVDFISIGWWPVFNLADLALVLGSGLVLGGFL